MKNSTKIFIALTSLVLWAACQQKAVYMTSSFVSFGSSSVSVAEDTGTVRIPIYAFQSNGSVAYRGAGAAGTNTSVTFNLVDSTARAGTDFELVEPANGVLTFQDDSVQYITVRIIERPNEETGALRFTIELLSATNGYTIGGTSKISVRITDNDQVGDELLGVYTATGFDYYSTQVTWTVTFSQGSGTNERLIDGLTPDLSGYDSRNGLYGTISADGLSFAIELPYWLNVTTDGYHIAYTLHDGTYLYTSAQTLTFTYEDGKWTSDNGIAIGLFDTYEDTSSYSGYVMDIMRDYIVLEAQ